MSEKDSVTKQYMQNAEIFADAFNYLIYNGEQVIKPENLHEMDTTAIVLPYGDDNESETVQKFRDVLKKATIMEDGNAAYVILGIENQSEIHYAMPVRNMLYDAMQYENQVTDASKSHRKAGNRGASRADFLSGFHKSDKLLPVITLIVYFGADEWDAPRSIHDMLLIKDERILPFVQDYKVNLIAPLEIPEHELDKFKTDLRIILKYIRYSKDRKKLKQMIEEDESYRDVQRETATLINTVTSSNLKISQGEESVDMCEAIKGIFEDGKAEGIVEGEAKGRAEGIVEGRAEEKARSDAKFMKALENLIALGMDENVARKALGLL